MVMTWGLDAADAEIGTAIPSAKANVAATRAERMLLITQPYISESLMSVTSVARTMRTGTEESEHETHCGSRSQVLDLGDRPVGRRSLPEHFLPGGTSWTAGKSVSRECRKDETVWVR